MRLLFIISCLALCACKQAGTRTNNTKLVVLDRLETESLPYGKLVIDTKLLPDTVTAAFPKSVRPEQWMLIKLSAREQVLALFAQQGSKPVMIFDANRNGVLTDDTIYPRKNNMPIPIRLVHPGKGDSIRMLEKFIPMLEGSGKGYSKEHTFSVYQPYRYGQGTLGSTQYRFAYYNLSTDPDDPYLPQVRTLLVSPDNKPFPSIHDAPVMYKPGDLIYLDTVVYRFEKATVHGDSLYFSYVETLREPMDVDVGTRALPITGSGLKSDSSVSPSLTGKYTLIDFWGTWCGPCKQLTPDIKRLFNKYNRVKLQIIGVAYDDERQPVIDYAAEQEMDWLQLFDQRKSTVPGVTQQYKIIAFPTFIIVDPKGEIVLREKGIDGFKKAAAYLKRLEE